MPENRNQILALLVAFAAGVAVGANWPEIKKKLAPLLKLAGDRMGDFYAQIAQSISEKKERVEDKMAERKYHSASKKARPKSGAKAAGASSDEETRFLESLVKMVGDKDVETAKAKPRRRAAPTRTAKKNPAPPIVEAGPEPVHEVG